MIAFCSLCSGSKIHDLCVTVPVFFTDVERQAIMDAASIAGLRIIALVDQGTALAVSYGNEQTFDSGVIYFSYRCSVLFISSCSAKCHFLRPWRE